MIYSTSNTRYVQITCTHEMMQLRVQDMYTQDNLHMAFTQKVHTHRITYSIKNNTHIKCIKHIIYIQHVHKLYVHKIDTVYIIFTPIVHTHIMYIK